MEKLLFTLILISGGLTLGCLLQFASKKGMVFAESTIPKLRKTLQKIGLLGFFPISFMSAVWIVSLSDPRLALFPFIGLLALVTGGACGFLASKFFRSTQEQVGVLFCCGSFTNIGAIGGLVAYVFLGEAAFALVALYKIFEEVFYYTVGFPFAKYCAQNEEEQKSFLARLWIVISDPFVFTALSALFIGATLNLSGIERPYFFTVLCAISVPIGTFILLVSIGLGMRFNSVRAYMKQSVAISATKFIIIPVVTCSAAYLAGFGQILDGLPLKVVCIVSSMPVGFNALVAASIYDLDLDLANSCWLVSTSLLLVVVPWLYFVSVLLL